MPPIALSAALLIAIAPAVALSAAADPSAPIAPGWMTTGVAMALIGLGNGLVALMVLKLNMDQSARSKADEVRADEVKATLQANTLAAQTAAADLDMKQTLQAETQARRAEAVRRTLEVSTEAAADQVAALDRKQDALASTAAGLAIVAESTHKLVNRDRGILLLKYLEKCKAYAALSGLPADAEEVARAQLDYDAHQSQQAAVDAMPQSAEAKAGKPEASHP